MSEKDNKIQGVLGPSIAIERTSDFFQTAQLLSDFIKDLPLDQPANVRLVNLMIEHIQQAEKGAFAHGFRMGMEYAKCQANDKQTVILN